MNEFKNKPEPKKIKMPPLVDRSLWYDTIRWSDDGLETQKTYEDTTQNRALFGD